MKLVNRQIKLMINILTHRYHMPKEIKDLNYLLDNLGFSKKAFIDLKCYAENTLWFNKIHRKHAIIVLALWFANKRNIESARKSLNFLNLLDNRLLTKNEEQKRVIMISECYYVLGEYRKAKKTIEKAIKMKPAADLFLAAANCEVDAISKTYWINKALALYKLKPLRINNVYNKRIFDSIESYEEKTDLVINTSIPKVTVLVPVYNAEDMLETALKSLLVQTWSHLEIIVIDDKSSDKSLDIAKRFSSYDSRIKVMESNGNFGTYVALNCGLQKATGDYVTCHGADDWSHPEKIEVQANHLLRNPAIIANTSSHVRATEELIFFRRGKFGKLLYRNISSFMFRRDIVMDQLGYWDSVRFSGDSELIRRVVKVFGKKRVKDLSTGPLSIVRQHDNSLTAHRTFGAHGFYMGIRREYLEAQRNYHIIAKSLYYQFPQIERPFPIPYSMRLNNNNKCTLEKDRHFDFIFATDLRDSCNVESLFEILAFLKKSGYNTGLLQVNKYSFTPFGKIQNRIRNILDEDKMQFIVYGEKVSCELLIMYDLSAFKEFQEYIPEVKPKKIRFIVDGYFFAKIFFTEISKIIKDSNNEIISNFLNYGKWIARTCFIKNLLNEKENTKIIETDSIVWPEILITEKNNKNVNSQRETVRIGIDLNTNQIKKMKFSKNIKIRHKIIPIDSHVDINIKQCQHDEYILINSICALIRQIDVFIFKNELSCLLNDRFILHCMSFGVPVILPPTFKRQYGDAALYAENSQEIFDHLSKLLSDFNYFLFCCSKANMFIKSKHSVKSYIPILKSYI